MRPARPPPCALPAGFEWQATPSELLARRASALPALEAAHYVLGAQPRVRPSDLRGRRPLLALESGAEQLVVRRLRHGGLLRALTGARYLDPARPFRELEQSERLAAAGVRTPEVVAARARRAPLVGWRLELVSRRVEQSCDLDALLLADLAAGRPAHARRALLRELGRFLRRLHEAGFLHRDLHLKNLLVRESEPPELYVLDLDRGELRADLGAALRVRMLARLWRWCARAARRASRPLPRLAAARVLAAYEPRREERRALARALARRTRLEARLRGHWR